MFHIIHIILKVQNEKIVTDANNGFYITIMWKLSKFILMMHGLWVQIQVQGWKK